MIKKLLKCNSFSEVYKTIGEKGFTDIMYRVLIMLCCTPVAGGIVNFLMRSSDKPYSWEDYNYNYMSLMNIVFILSVFSFAAWAAAKKSYTGKSVREQIKELIHMHKGLGLWLLLLVWSIIPLLFSANIRKAFFGSTFLSSGYISYIYTLCILGCAYKMTQRKKEQIYGIMVGVADFTAIVMLAFQYDVPILKNFTADTGISVFVNSNHYGYYLTMVSICAVGQIYRSLDNDDPEKNAGSKCIYKTVFYMISFALFSWALMINDSMGAFLAIVAGMILMLIIWIIRYKRVRALYFYPLVIMGLMFGLSYNGIITSKLDSTIGQSFDILIRDIFNLAHKTDGYKKGGSGRIELWLRTIECIKKRPILGYGPDTMFDKSGNAVIWLTPHNEYLECAFYLGIPGAIMYIGGLILGFSSFFKEFKKRNYNEIIAATVVIAYLMSAFWGVRIYSVAPYMYMFLGLMLTDRDKEEPVL